MNYQETTEYLFNSTPVFEKIGAKAYKPGLQTTFALDDHFGHPHQKYKTIHIAGTNGKGSCSHTLAAILQSQGYKVGLYTSPHLVDFRERIRVNGECVPEQYVIDFVEENRAFFEPLHPSFFELTTAMALKYFAEQKVDYAVIEVGLGGRLDCTNIITPILSIITNISFDHTQFLGNTLAEIAGEKAGIIKPGVPVVIGEYLPETRTVFEKKAKSENAPILFAQDFDVTRLENSEPSDVDMELKGSYQERNKKTILTALHILRQKLAISDEAIHEGFAHVCELTGLRGRWEKLNDAPLTICDTGHNLAGWSYLAPQINAVKAETKHIVFGMVDDKDVAHVLQLLKEMLENRVKYYWTQPSTKRAIPVEKLSELALKLGLHGSLYHSVKEAYNAALENAEKGDFVFVGGSSYVVADLLS
ncbi:bifunctional folylpolyglutamate synthase/dihydrofolate synthase [Prevotella copri]|jgi:dihydrofolate synthase / folylpolyglutamate synthase|uniref:Dihydrofolate synthase/folylpolyglutamate synthase n=1 Tax=Segatella copri TaxID=165179 RepID=A0AAW5ILJ3_9BACT|nr:folylpolyglutamate synthase/dihydrofolate synthase family protein [Segatella copri]MCP9534132.1 bifunctional folylpolyglutamate synthase/dihydrofolate synthase [Segatella copri]MCP9536912.1 bifunctional folylpolyglutamate synthase/dihydrofolate synthase [Segatella copri]MCP9540101.1 bifunctional folylpolyglutamate synthase/dihydrofolate synthase [Segatella copri]MCP9558317.1 bifunctional folylpolyglutamate synthase/dihydrofolate synthase [Segatella copri]MCP9561127.1 bifunctional folylpolyg